MRRAALPAVSAALAVAGVACLAIGLAFQQRVPEPPAAPPATLERAPAPVSRERVPAQASLGRVPAQASRPPTTGPVLATSAPTLLEIPSIGVRSQLLQLGMAADGTLEVPPRGPTYDRAGWYRYSPTPGALGPAVIAGHLDSAANGPSVFFRLGGLKPGDTVLVTRADGSVAVFAVDSVSRFPKARFPSELVYGDTDHAALRLITCGGDFDPASGHYLNNIVVLASLLRSSPPPG